MKPPTSLCVFQAASLPQKTKLLDGDGGAGSLELLLDFLGLGLVDSLDDRSGSALDGGLGLLEAEAGDLAHDLDDGFQRPPSGGNRFHVSIPYAAHRGMGMIMRQASAPRPQT